MTKISISEHVSMVRELHSRTFSLLNSEISVRDFLRELVGNLYDAFIEGDMNATIELRNYHPKCIGLSSSHILDHSLDLRDFELTIINEFGYANPMSLRTNSDNTSPKFEKAVEHVVNGRLDALNELISMHPELVRQRSPFGHRATLLHYVGCNGVEIFRQIVPQNICDIALLLIAKGSEKSAKANFYGNTYDTLALAASSSHLDSAGVKNKITEILK